MKRIVIVGGGAAGLAAAYALRRAQDGGAPLDWVLLEKDERLGGKIWTKYENGFTVDGGPDCYLAEKPWVAQMAARLGIADQLMPSNDASKHTYIYARRRLHEVPEGVMMMVPTKFTPFATTSLFSWRGKMRMGLDLVVPRRKGGGDETLGQFVRRRLGRECLERLAEPMVGGVHASDPDEMSLLATFPRFLQMEQKYGSLIRGFVAARKTMPPAPPKAGTPPRTYFMTLSRGMQQLTDALASAAGRDRLRTGRMVVHVDAAGDGAGYLVRTADGETREADALIVAAEAYHAARFLKTVDEGLARDLEAITSASAATVSLGFARQDVGHDLRGFGFLVPRVEGRRISASTWSSTKWDGRAPDNAVLVRVFVGGAHNQELVSLDDNAMVGLVREELRQIMGISAPPVGAWVFRWPQGMPQYKVGHLDRLAAIEARLTSHPGLFLCGASYRGVGTGDVMNSAEQAVAAALGLTANSSAQRSSADAGQRAH